MKKSIFFTLFLTIALFLFGCGSKEADDIVASINTENASQYIKILETKTDENEVYCRIQNISPYYLDKVFLDAELLDNLGKPIQKEYFPSTFLEPNYIEQLRIYIFDPIPEWSGKVNINIFFAIARDNSK
jgi:hypothetical protein